jgi:hypothetical protein
MPPHQPVPIMPRLICLTIVVLDKAIKRSLAVYSAGRKGVKPPVSCHYKSLQYDTRLSNNLEKIDRHYRGV